MPSVDLKESVLNGRGSICSNSKGSSTRMEWFRFNVCSGFAEIMES